MLRSLINCGNLIKLLLYCYRPLNYCSNVTKQWTFVIDPSYLKMKTMLNVDFSSEIKNECSDLIRIGSRKSVQFAKNWFDKFDWRNIILVDCVWSGMFCNWSVKGNHIFCCRVCDHRLRFILDTFTYGVGTHTGKKNWPKNHFSIAIVKKSIQHYLQSNRMNWTTHTDKIINEMIASQWFNHLFLLQCKVFVILFGFMAVFNIILTKW